MLRLTQVIAAFLVLLALLLAGYAWMLGRQPAPRPTPAPVTKAPEPSREAHYPVVVATRALPAGRPIDPQALRVAHLPIDPPGAFRDVNAAAGRVPVSGLGEGTPLMESQLVSGLASRLEPGERAVAVKADEVLGIGGNVRPGDQVDVFFSVKADGKDVERSQSRLLLARKRVLAFGAASVDEAPADAPEGARRQNSRTQTARTVVLAVGVDEVNRLALGEAAGRLWLALRNPGDTAEPDATLFDPLPTVLAVRTAAANQKPLSAMDLAQAGLATTDLATGGNGARAAPARSSARLGTTRRTAAPAQQGQAVEFIRGDRRETLHY